MKNLIVKLQNRNLNIQIEVTEFGVYVNTDFDGRKRNSSYSNIDEAINNTTLVPVKNYLKTLI